MEKKTMYIGNEKVFYYDTYSDDDYEETKEEKAERKRKILSHFEKINKEKGLTK